jgi:hypothetical protein
VAHEIQDITQVIFPQITQCHIWSTLEQHIFSPDMSRPIKIPTDASTTIEKDVHNPHMTTMSFVVEGVRVAVVRLDDLENDFKHADYVMTGRAQRVAQKGKNELGMERPPLWMVQQVLAALLDEVHNGEFSGKNGKKWSIGASLAHGELVRHREDPAFRAWLDHMRAHPEQMSSKRRRILKFVQEQYKKDEDNDQHQLLVDEQIANKCVKHLTDLDVILIINKDYQVIQSVFVEFLQKVCGQATKAAIDRTMTDFSYLYPLNKPDHRHGSNSDEHLPANPDLDVNIPACADRHHAVCGTGHFGTAHAIGRWAFNEISLRKFSHATEGPDGLDKTHAWDQLMRRVIPGPVRLMHEANSWILKRIDPAHHAACVAINNLVPEDKKFSIVANDPAGFNAYLHGPRTERHIDTQDFVGGQAGLQTFGEFRGGDLVTPELGLRVPFPSGSLAHVRGNALTHYTTGHTGVGGRASQRKTLVMTNHDSVRGAVELEMTGSTEHGGGDTELSHEGNDKSI